MNFLCHAIPYLDDPWVAAATAIPDWLSVVDRKIRARRRYASAHVHSDDPTLCKVAQGIIHHHDDDRWFHGSQSFVTTNLELAVQLRDRLPGDDGFRPSFVGHILIEMMLDKFWLEDQPEFGTLYYDAIESVDAFQLQRCVNVITGRSTDGLVEVMERFRSSRFLYDYLDHDKLLWRLNQVMKRVRLASLPETLLDWFPDVEQQVRSQRDKMLTPPGDSSSFPSTIPSDESA